MKSSIHKVVIEIREYKRLKLLHATLESLVKCNEYRVLFTDLNFINKGSGSL